ncbi:PstS family phosphate ABC transporter substrate-binding protein [Candidatus Nitronereus thalassa]|uniref:Substrate-binding domain-containing protein n=1 Tax=Candidatus Nitronereus thalassa TaxID=3020898 RepID=A0ABU3KB34_9BACT|nr:substrate-binding domain-containing protein [Candidatus Nitronereus thalassa]MDT7043705.1 substrate-binding domain-containing protein [Candidatus Nitronereus thalassa]
MPITAIGSTSTIHLVEDLVESAQNSQPGLLIKVRSVNVAVTPEWWNLTDFPTIAIFSGPIADEHLATFQRQRHAFPLHLSIGIDAMIIVTHKTNPISERGLTLAQIDAIFSMTRNRGHSPVHLWRDIDLNGAWKQRPINIIGQDASSSYFRNFIRHALKEGDFKHQVIRLPNSASVVKEVSRDKYAIGYTSKSALTTKVKIVPLKSRMNSDFIVPTFQQVQGDHYPLLVTLSLYSDANSNEPLDPTVQELLDFILSRQGQEVLLQRGYTPLTPQQIQQERSKIRN